MIGLLVLLSAGACAETETQDVPADRLFAIAEMRLEDGLDEEALRLYHRAADEGHWRAQMKLSSYYAWGSFPGENGTRHSTPRRDTAWANEWHQKAVATVRRKAKAGDAEAMFVLGQWTFSGKAGQLDRDEAFRWWEAAKEAGHPEAAYVLARFRYGDGVQDEAELATLHEAGEAGWVEAYQFLARHYSPDQGVEPDMEQHVFWLRKAAMQDEYRSTRYWSKNSLRALAEKGLIADSLLVE